MGLTDLMFGIGAEYKGRPAFNKANKDIFGLQKGIKTLAKGYVGLAGAQKAFAYAQASVKAFAQDDLAAQKLSKTLGNLGLAYEQTNVENFIAGLEKTFHIADDFLRPAFDKLVRTTQSYTKSKELLTVALNASAGAGVDLTTTVDDLSQAYVGNLKGLKKYNLGLTNAELAAMSFEQIQAKLNDTFSGQAAKAADTYAFKIEAINIAAGNAKETIGKGLVDALTSATSQTGNVNDLADAMNRLAVGTSYGIKGVIGVLSAPGKLLQFIAKQEDKLLGRVAKARANNTPYDPMSGRVQGLSAKEIKIIQARAKADALSAKRQKELAALAVKQTKAIKEQTALQKAKAVLDQASAVMNMDLIQNTAALMGKVTADEALRLKLQQAILLGNSEAAGSLAQQLLSSQIAAMKLQGTNPLGGWSDAFDAAIRALQQLRTELALLGAMKVAIPTMATATAPTSVAGAGAPFTTTNNGQTIYTPWDTGTSQKSSVNVNVSMNPDAAKLFITDVVVGNSANGNQNSLTRVTTPWMI
jgi:hypothetical protein